MNMDIGWASWEKICLLYWLNLPSVNERHGPHSPPLSLSLSLAIPHLSAHLCQGGLSGVVKLSIARKCSFIKADRRGGRLLKLITPRSCSKPQSFTVQHLRKGRTCRGRGVGRGGGGDRESDSRLKQKNTWSLTFTEPLQLKQERAHLQSESERQSSKLHIFRCLIINQAQNPQRDLCWHSPRWHTILTPD